MKKLLIGSLVAVLLCVACVGTTQSASRDVLSKNTNVPNVVYVPETNNAFETDEPIARGLYTSLSLSINCGDGKVWATVKNDFTLFPSKVSVILELYSSEKYHEYYTDMGLEFRKTVDDLDMGDSMSVQVYTYGKTKYWIARMSYKIDNKDWAEKVTKPILVDGDGNYITL